MAISVLYFVPLFVLGNYVLVNLFIAIICWGWDSAKPDEDEFAKLKSEEERLVVERQRLQLSRALSQLNWSFWVGTLVAVPIVNQATSQPG